MQSSKQSIQEKVRQGILSDYPLIYITGWDEASMETMLAGVCAQHYQDKSPLISWSMANGFSDTHDDMDPHAAISRILEATQPGMYLLKDLPALLTNDPGLIRALRDLYYALRNSNKFIFMSHPTVVLPDLLSKEVYLVEMPLPVEKEIHDYLKNNNDIKNRRDEFDDEFLQVLTVAMTGLTFNEIDHTLKRILSHSDTNSDQAIMEAQQEKAQILNKESCLQFIPQQFSLDDIGGLENLKQWVMKRKTLFTEEAFATGIPLPSGVLFMGVSGCGKSMAAKTIAAAWNVPLVRLDMSLVLSGSFGAPEAAFAHATHLAEQIAPIVLWIDELENSFGYDEQSSSHGNINIFSSFLTWMQDKSARVFLAATANRIQQIPAELMRKGRFDQLFFLDLPTKNERMQIFKIHILRQGGDPDNFELGYLAAASKAWSGAEIEQAVKSARIDAYQEKREFVEKDIIHNISGMIPLSQTMQEQIKFIKDWSSDRAVPASAAED